jgi:peroxiredoxin
MVVKKWWVLILFFLFPPVLWAGAPDIVLKDFLGRDRNVNEFIGRGKWVVVAVWAHDCHVCNDEIHHMISFHNAHKDKGAAVLGVTIDGEDMKKKAQIFVDKHKLPFPNLIAEPEQDVLMKFGAGMFVGTPTFYIYNPTGDLVAKEIGPITRTDVENFLKQETAAQADKN